ncbi:MAG: undecaprenyl-phosphate glucose phosphotransferase [Nitrincola lacisaponensis]|uniref:undecaprenyl-phosphate glucose phosphotransferase n=1 Tax=Nitrincola lacisaponensis TaxID=267850 RepID=UPI00391BD95A
MAPAKLRIKPHESKLSALARLADAAIIVITLWCLIELFGLEWVSAYYVMAITAIVVFNFISEISLTYRSWRGAGLKAEIIAVASNWFAVVMLFILIDFFFKPTDLYNRELLLTWFLLTPVELVCWHGIMRAFLSTVRETGHNTRAVAIYGATELGREVRSKIEDMPWAGYNFIGYFDDRNFELGRREESQVEGGHADLVERAKAGEIEVIFIALPLRAEKRIKSLLDELADTTVSVHMMLDVFSFDLLSARWVDLNGMPAISIFESPHVGINSMSKRAVDLVFGSMILTLISIPMLLIALGVKLSSPGPVFFKQKRYGVNGQEINVLKFRSMRVMDAGDGEVKQATKNDSRITPFGAFIRRTSLDELPQFLNVIGGSMSIVGPRPHAVSHNEFYRGQIHGYMLRHKVKPGITGLAQINGFRGETDTLDKMEGRIRYDLEYIRTWSVWLDVKIIFLTVFKGFVHKNAY